MFAESSVSAFAIGWLMVTSATDYTVVRFSSCALPKDGRGKALEELHERGLLPTKFIHYGNAAPRVDLINRTMPGLRILTAGFTSVRREGVRQEGDLLYLCMTLTGTTVGSRGGGGEGFCDGDAVVLSNDGAPRTQTPP